MQQDRAFRCFVHGAGHEWQAICTDLDISVEGASLREAADTLGDAIRTHVLDALREDATNAAKLLSRRSPWHVVLRLSFAADLTAFREWLKRSPPSQRAAGTFSTLCLS